MSRILKLLAALVAAGQVLGGCTSLLANAPVEKMTATQLHEFAKIKDANVTCIIVSSPYGKGSALFLSLDKAVIPVGSVKVDDNCVATITTGPATVPPK